MSSLKDWQKHAKVDSELKKELAKLKGTELKEAFNGDLEFGTGGIRGIMGAGTNRLNIYTLRKANYGFSKYLVKKYKEDITRGVVISHDNRFNSREFAIDTCRVLGSFGIKCFMFESLRPTPVLSYAVRFLNCIAGIMITASHNPPKYNGYKIYDETGCQLTPVDADEVIKEVNKVEDIFNINVADINVLERMGLYNILDNKVDDSFIKEAKSVVLNDDLEKKIKIVYTPLHGTGSTIGKRVLDESGYSVSFVEEQLINDPSFKTVKSPNPEDKDAFILAEKLGKKTQADLLIATDPDADRVGIGVLDKGKYVYLTGNETGSLLIDYYLKGLKELNLLPKKGKIFNTIVTSDLGAIIAKSYGVSCYQTLTGFKYIGEQSNLIENTDTKYLFGYEESYGYLIKDYCKDKDSIQSLLLISDMTNYYKVKENKTLVDKLNDLYSKFGYFKEYTKNYHFEGIDGKSKMDKITEYFRNTNIDSFNNKLVLVKEDYKLSTRIQISNNIKTKLTLPKSNVIKYYLENDSWIVIRPSGTEPKLKVYFSCKGESIKDSLNMIDGFIKDINKIIGDVI